MNGANVKVVGIFKVARGAEELDVGPKKVLDHGCSGESVALQAKRRAR